MSEGRDNEKVLCKNCRSYSVLFDDERCKHDANIKSHETDRHTGHSYHTSHTITEMRDSDNLCGECGKLFEKRKGDNNSLFYFVLAIFAAGSFVYMWLTY